MTNSDQAVLNYVTVTLEDSHGVSKLIMNATYSFLLDVKAIVVSKLELIESLEAALKQMEDKDGCFCVKK